MARHLAFGHPPNSLIVALAHALLREDAGFHPYQIFEAGVRQFHKWADPKLKRHIMIAVAPVSRNASRSTIAPIVALMMRPKIAGRMNPKAMQKPVAYERAYDANRNVPDETKTVAPYNLPRQPSGNEPDDQNDDQSLIRQMHALSFSLRSDLLNRFPST